MNSKLWFVKSEKTARSLIDFVLVRGVWRGGTSALPKVNPLLLFSARNQVPLVRKAYQNNAFEKFRHLSIPNFPYLQYATEAKQR